MKRASLRRLAPCMLVLAGVLLAGSLPAGTAHAQTPIQITKVRDLSFGGCDNVGGTTYTVNPAASAGAGACFGATSAQFSVVGDPNRRARVRLANTVVVSNGAENLTVSLTDSVGGAIVCLGTGNITIFVGGSVQLPAAGTTTFGLFLGPETLELAYIGGGC